MEVDAMPIDTFFSLFHTLKEGKECERFDDYRKSYHD